MVELTDDEHEAYGAMIHRAKVEAALRQPDDSGIAPEVLWQFRDASIRELLLEITRLRAVKGALVRQIEINDFVDSLGHEAKMLKAFHDARDA